MANRICELEVSEKILKTRCEKLEDENLKLLEQMKGLEKKC